MLYHLVETDHEFLHHMVTTTVADAFRVRG
jgi:hypothetical protein